MKAIVLVWLAIIIAGGYGWIMNIVSLAGMDAVLSTGMGILRIVGIFVAPLGAVLGYF